MKNEKFKIKINLEKVEIHSYDGKFKKYINNIKHL